MTKNNKFHIPDKKGMDEIIKMGVEMDIPDVKDVITDEDLLAAGYSLPPADLLEKTKKRIEEEQKASKKVFSIRKAGKVIGIAATIFILLFAAMQAEGVRVYIVNIVNSITDNGIEFHSGHDHFESYNAEDETAYKDADKALGISTLKPKQLPQGFSLDRIKIYPDSHVFFVYKNGSKTIRLNQAINKEGMNIESSIHSEDGKPYILKAQETEIPISSHKQLETNDVWLSAVWSNETLVYKVEGNCSKEDFEHFILNLK